MEGILLPDKIEIIPGKDDRHATLVIEPCWYGYGTTLGNALRRVLLSSLPGAAVTAVKIKGVQHEFMSVPNVQEDVLDIILNLKQLRLRCHSAEPVRLRLTAKGEGPVRASDIEPNSDIEITNPDLVIATVTDKKGELEMELVVGTGRGYVTTEERDRDKSELGLIAIDALYSPVKEVGYRVENTRVGRITNYDRLIMDITTDGTVSPVEAVDSSVQILLDQFNSVLTRGGTRTFDVPSEDGTAENEETTVGDSDEADGAGEEAPKKRGRKAATAKSSAKKTK
ncbi:DNA-directed RNA polymerase subunit alpha [Candidatus Uhrbacteria bacterium]|nr:DNA-directed RNA polymerase subunit alpha [Candidatus Uhrbacteria bacterium]